LTRCVLIYRKSRLRSGLRYYGIGGKKLFNNPVHRLFSRKISNFDVTTISSTPTLNKMSPINEILQIS
jgi:hypothetical protein